MIIIKRKLIRNSIKKFNNTAKAYQLIDENRLIITSSKHTVSPFQRTVKLGGGCLNLKYDKLNKRTKMLLQQGASNFLAWVFFYANISVYLSVWYTGFM